MANSSNRRRPPFHRRVTTSTATGVGSATLSRVSLTGALPKSNVAGYLMSLKITTATFHVRFIASTLTTAAISRTPGSMKLQSRRRTPPGSLSFSPTYVLYSRAHASAKRLLRDQQTRVSARFSLKTCQGRCFKCLVHSMLSSFLSNYLTDRRIFLATI